MENRPLGQKINQSLHEIYLGSVKVFLLEAMDGSLILVDTGMPNSQQKIVSYINSIGKSVSDVKYILLTHAHIDHMGSAADIKKLSNAMLGINERGIGFVDGSSGLEFPDASKAKNLKTRIMLKIAKRFVGAKKPKFVKPDMILKEGIFPKHMHLNARVLETPGHTQDSISIYLADSKTVIVGDLMFGNTDKLIAPKFYDDYIALLGSVKKIRDLNPDLICVSHGKNHNVSDIGL
ncbi:MAG: MBL fold metallo-hydrolase [Candidatus Parvarchaeota archaeon]|nr:MBL fold metallo-hydrolase [Candidatus Parvarchaeota archaeon]